MKKFIASILVICIALSSVITSLGDTVNKSTDIITKEADLRLSDRLVYYNADNSVNTAIQKFTPGEKLSLRAQNKVVQSGFSVGTTAAAEYSKQVTLEYTEGENYSGYVKIEEGKKYIVNVNFSAKPDSGTKVQIALVAANSPFANDSTTKTLACKEFSNGALNDNQTISAVFDAGTNGADINDYLRLFFAGSGDIVIKSVIISQLDLSDSNDYMTVNYVNGGLNNVEFTKKDTHTTPEFKGAVDAVFDGWYEDSALTNKSETPTENGTYYAKWASVTRNADLKNANRMANYNANNQDRSVLDLTLATNTEPLKVVINAPSVTENFWPGSNSLDKNNSPHLSHLQQQISLEYFDNEPNVVQDTTYSGYVSIETGKQYAINVTYSVSDFGSNQPQIAVMANNTNLSYGTGASQIVACAAPTTEGKYVLSNIIYPTYGGSEAGDKLRLAFAGQGTFEIHSVTITEVYQSSDIKPVLYKDSPNDYAGFVFKDAELMTPSYEKEGYLFEGWFNSENKRITSWTDLVNTEKANTLNAKWLLYNVIYDLDLGNTQLLKDENGSNQVVIETELKDDNKTLDVTLNSGWNNIFRDEEDNLKTDILYPDAIMALKFDKGTNASSYLKLQKDYKYIVNVEYEVLSADSYYNPQIAIVINNSTNSSQVNGSKVINSNTHSAPGKYAISAVLSEIDNVPLRLAFGGIGSIEIKSVKVNLERKYDESLIDITYIDGESSYTQFHKLNSDLYVPVKDGFIFDGWYNEEGEKVEDIKDVTTSLTLYSKWTGVNTLDIDVTDSQSLKDKNGSNESVMEIEPDDKNKSLEVTLKSGWNNIFRDKDNNLRDSVLYPDAIIALKNDKDTDASSYVKLQKDYKYIVNIEYEVTSADASFNPQIAIVLNNATNSSQINGSKVLNSNTHSAPGKYTISAVVSDVDNIPLRLAFGGIGRIIVKKVFVSYIIAEDKNLIDVTYVDGESSYSQFYKLNSELYTPDKDGFEFAGWFNDAGDKVENLEGIKDSITLYAKWTGVESFDINPSDSEALRYQNNSKETVLEIEPNKNDKTLEVTLNSGWNNIFRDKNGVLRTKTKDSNGKYVTNILWPDAILALKYDTSKEPASYVKLKKDYEYVINIDYSVKSVYTDFAPQIAIVRNNQTNSTGINGSVVLNANTHIEKGDYSISAHVKHIDNIPIRLAFGGIGRIVIKKITISSIIATDDSYIPVMYVDNESNSSEFIKKGLNLSNPKDMTGFKGWYKNANCIGKPITKTDKAITVYSKRNLPAYTFNIDFDTKATKDFYKSGNHTLSDFDKVGSKTEIVSGVGIGNTDAARLTYKRIDSDSSDYASNPMLALYDTNITEGEITDKRFLGKVNTQYIVTFKYKVEEVDSKSLELYLGKRHRGQSGNADINDFGTGLWQINETVKIGETITETTDGWVDAKAYFTASSGWFPVILLKTNNQSKSTDIEGDLASVLIDDICVTEIVPIMDDTHFGKMDYEDYEVKVYDSSSVNGIIGNKYGLEVSKDANHTSKGKKSLKLTLQSDSLRYSGNTVISINNEPLRTEKGSAYIVEFWVMSKVDIDDVIWGVSSVAGEYTSVTSKYNIEIRDKINLKANKWQKVKAYIPKLTSFEDASGMLSIALAANGNDGKVVYIDDISVEQKIESDVINFADSDTENPFASFAQRAFKGEKINTLPSAQKDGYLFDGWYDTPECEGKEYKVSDIFPVKKDEITLYAKWIDESTVDAKDFTAGSFDADVYDEGVVPYENICESSLDPIYGINNVDSTQSGAWVKDSGIYGNGTAEYDGTLSLSNDTYSRFLDTSGRNAISLTNEDGTKFAVVKGQKYSIKFDYVNGSNQGTSYIQTVISTSNGYEGFGYGKGQGLKTIAIHGTDVDYQTYQEYFIADFTGFVYITLAARTDDNSPYRSLYHRVYIDNLEISVDNDVKKVNFIADGKVYRTYYGKKGDSFPVFDVIEGDMRTTEFAGFYKEPEFKNKITKYKLTNEEVQNIYIKYKEVKYDTPSDFSSSITLDFEETKILDDYYRQGKHMTYWFRGEQNPEWQLISNDSTNAYKGKNYMKLNGYTTYWNEAKFVLYDTNNKSGTMLLEKGATYRVKVMSRCEDKYDNPTLTITLENPSSRYLLANNDKINMVWDQVEYDNGYMCFVADIIVPETLEYLPSLAIRKNANDLQTLFIDYVNVEKIIDCKVTFEENGGTEIEDVIVQIHEKLDDPGMPFNFGYEFIGWYSDANFNNLWDFETMTVESDMTLYAKWQEEIEDEPSYDFNDDNTSQDTPSSTPSVDDSSEENVTSTPSDNVSTDDNTSSFTPSVDIPNDEFTSAPVIENIIPEIQDNTDIYLPGNDNISSEDVIVEDVTVSIDNGSAPVLLDGDKYEYPSSSENNGLSTWVIVLISIGGLLVLSGAGILVWLLLIRKKNKK